MESDFYLNEKPLKNCKKPKISMFEIHRSSMNFRDLNVFSDLSDKECWLGD